MSQYFLLHTPFDSDGFPVFRDVKITPEKFKEYLAWIRKTARGDTLEIPPLEFVWTGSSIRPSADYLVCGETGGVWSHRSIDSEVGAMLKESGSLFGVSVEGDRGFYIFRPSIRVDGVPNDDFNLFKPSTLRSIAISADLLDTAIFLVEEVPGFVVSNEFKAACESAGLTGMAFYPVEVIQG